MKATQIVLLIMVLFMFDLAVLPASTLAQSARDINGWNGARWGMTESELTAVFKDQIIKTERQYIDNNRLYRELEISKYAINGTDFKVLFEMGSNDNKLKSVRLILSPAIAAQFSEFEQLLTAKYGPPSQTDESASRREGRKNSSWLLPLTKIELLYLIVPGYFYVLNITYTDLSSLSLDKL